MDITFIILLVMAGLISSALDIPQKSEKGGKTGIPESLMTAFIIYGIVFLLYAIIPTEYMHYALLGFVFMQIVIAKVLSPLIVKKEKKKNSWASKTTAHKG